MRHRRANATGDACLFIVTSSSLRQSRPFLLASATTPCKSTAGSETTSNLPTYGSIQGADMALQTKRGNSFDTASLLIGLLRAANIPARYVYGIIKVSADKSMSWVGGVTQSEAALQLMRQVVIPNIGLASGGQITFIKLEHVYEGIAVKYGWSTLEVVSRFD